MDSSRRDLFTKLGKQTYRIERSWVEAPSGGFPGRCIDVAINSRDELLVCQRYDFSIYHGVSPTIYVFDKAGKPIRQWESERVCDSHHIFIDPADRLFIVDRGGHQVIAFDCDGNELFCIGGPDRPGSPFSHPTSVAVSPSGELYVADGYGAAHVHRFSADGQLISTWGGPGSGKGQFSTPHGICVASDGRVFVGDREANRVQIFSPEGEYLSELNEMYHPMSVCGDGKDNIYVSDQATRVIAFDRDGRRLGHCSPVLREGHGMCLDSEGNIYLVDGNPERVTRLGAVQE